MFFILNDLLSKSDVAAIRSSIAVSHFVDGSITGSSNKDAKHNLEMQVGDQYLSVVDRINRSLDASTEANVRMLPRYRTNPIINRYDAGMFYSKHVDSPVQGGVSQLGRVPGRFGQNFVRTDYSITVFLSDLESYDGGELQLTENDEERLIKLPAGSAVCYTTGIPHCVRPVTRGSRVAAIYWIQSMVRDCQLRSLSWDQYCLERKLRDKGLNELANEMNMIHSNFVRSLCEI